MKAASAYITASRAAATSLPCCCSQAVRPIIRCRCLRPPTSRTKLRKAWRLSTWSASPRSRCSTAPHCAPRARASVWPRRRRLPRGCCLIHISRITAEHPYDHVLPPDPRYPEYNAYGLELDIDLLSLLTHSSVTRQRPRRSAQRAAAAAMAGMADRRRGAHAVCRAVARRASAAIFWRMRSRSTRSPRSTRRVRRPPAMRRSSRPAPTWRCCRMWAVASEMPSAAC